MKEKFKGIDINYRKAPIMMFLKIVQPFFCEQDCPAFLYTIITAIKILVQGYALC